MSATTAVSSSTAVIIGTHLAILDRCMPRVPPSLLRRAHRLHACLPLLLLVCRDLRSAINELRWLQDHIAHTSKRSRNEEGRQRAIFQLVSRRARGEPLQYIIGTEYFGDLEIVCRPGVLIPRQETAASVSHLVDLLSAQRSRRSAVPGVRVNRSGSGWGSTLCPGNTGTVLSSKSWPALVRDLPARLRLLDICTGTGCIPLLFRHAFRAEPVHRDVALDQVAIDISQKAIDLARHNLETQNAIATAGRDVKVSKSADDISFVEADVLRDCGSEENSVPPSVPQALRKLHATEERSQFDILISNPPYISSSSFGRTTSRSVRNYEPKLALVPPLPRPMSRVNDGDTFYPRLLDIADQVRAKIVLFEVADLEQAERVVQMAAMRGVWQHMEIWRDNPNSRSAVGAQNISVGGNTVVVKGSGHGRSVLFSRAEGTAWLGLGPAHS